MSEKNKTKSRHDAEVKKLREKVRELESELHRQEQKGSAATEREDMFKTLIDTLPQKIFFKDTNSVFISANKHFAADLGIEPEEINGKRGDTWFPEELNEKYEADDRRIMKSGKTEEIEEKYIQDGEERFVYTVKTPVQTDSGETIGLLGIFWDITEKKRTEEELKKHREKLEVLVEQRTNELEQRNAALEAIHTVFHEAMKCDTDKEVAEACLLIAQELTGSAFGFIGELNHIGRFDTIALSNPGWEACAIQDSDKTQLIKNREVRGIWGTVLKSEKSLIVNDPSAHPDSVGTPEGHPPLTSFLGIPLKHGDRLFGMIALANRKPGYDESDKEKIEMLTTAFVEVLRQKRLEMELSRKAQEILELSTPVLKVWDGVICSPLIGTLDSQRTQQFMERMLQEIVKTSSPLALIDITGVPFVDTQTAQHLLETVNSVKLLGSKAVLTGVSPNIAQTLVHLGVEMGDVITRSSLVSGLRVALEELGYEVVSKNGEEQ